MCRLFAYVSPEPATADGELGPTGKESMLSLSRLHGDGWGWAGVRRLGDAPVMKKSALSAASDPAFDAALGVPARAAMVHLRWATSGLPVAERNAHPFRSGDLAFEHNGSLRPIGDIAALLTAQTRASLTGDTDSEMYFALIREQIAFGASLPEATATVARQLRKVFPHASLNAILLDRAQLVVVHASARSILSDDDLHALGDHPHLPDEHNEDYFALRWSHADDGTILIGSTGVAAAEWQALPAESVTVIDLVDRSTSTLELAPAAASHS